MFRTLVGTTRVDIPRNRNPLKNRTEVGIVTLNGTRDPWETSEPASPVNQRVSEIIGVSYH